MDPKIIEEIARTVVGDHTGWQSRFAAVAGISRSHLSNVLSGARPVSAGLRSTLMVLCIDQGMALRARAKHLETLAQKVKTVEPGAKFSREEYQRQADEAEGIVEDLAFGAVEAAVPDDDAVAMGDLGLSGRRQLRDDE